MQTMLRSDVPVTNEVYVFAVAGVLQPVTAAALYPAEGVISLLTSALVILLFPSPGWPDLLRSRDRSLFHPVERVRAGLPAKEGGYELLLVKLVRLERLTPLWAVWEGVFHPMFSRSSSPFSLRLPEC